MSLPSQPASPSLVSLARRLSEVSVVRFGVVGVSNTLLGYSVFRGAHRVLPAAASQALSYLVGMLWSYYWNRRWTFKSQDNVASEAPASSACKSASCCSAPPCSACSSITLHQNPTLSWIGTSALCTVLNFVASRFWPSNPPERARRTRRPSARRALHWEERGRSLGAHCTSQRVAAARAASALRAQARQHFVDVRRKACSKSSSWFVVGCRKPSCIACSIRRGALINGCE